MSEEKVTVITVVYNLIKSGRVKYFKQMLRSVRNQTYKNIEHIVMDGKSTDGTLSLLDKYQKKGYIKYYSEKDNGPYDAMNKGIKLFDFLPLLKVKTNANGTKEYKLFNFLPIMKIKKK